MNWLDAVLGLILLLSVIGGLRAGLVREIIGLAALVLGVVLGLWFYGMAAALVLPHVSSKHLANAIGFFLVFGGVMLVGALITFVIEKLLKLARLSWMNRLMGGVFGLLRGALVAAVIVLALMAFSTKPPPRSVAESRLAPHVVDVARVMAAIAPYEVKEGFRQSYEKVKELWAETMKKGIRRLGNQEL
jgi:membrane protein required for colicin V production